MSPVVDSALFDSTASDLFRLSDSLKKLTRYLDSNGVDAHRDHHHRHHGEEKEMGNVPVDIVETQKEYIFFLDAPGLSKSDIQVNLEDEKVLVVKSGGGGKRKREETEEEEGCRYLRLERTRASTKFLRKFRLPENANPSAITAKCESGVLTVVVEKLPPPETKSKTVEVKIA